MEKVYCLVQQEIHFQVTFKFSQINFKAKFDKSEKIGTLACLTQVYNATKKGKCLFVQ